MSKKTSVEGVPLPPQTPLRNNRRRSKSIDKLPSSSKTNQTNDESDHSSEASDESYCDIISSEPQEQEEIVEPSQGVLESHTWTEIKRTARQKWLRDFDLNSGPQNHDLTASSSPVSFFKLLFTESLIEDIRQWTNQAASQKINNTKRSSAKKKKWYVMRKEKGEMEAFLGCIMVMGVVRMASLKHYWSSSSKLFSNDGIQELFSLQRFFDIYSNLCLRDDKKIDLEDKLAKIRPVITTIISMSQFYYLPSRDLAIDEAMIPFSVRHRLVQFMPMKPIRYGFKAFVLSESCSGFVLNWRMYTGEPNNDGHGATYQTVMALSESLEGEGWRIYSDRYYTSIQLFHDLKNLDIGACGTIMSNRLRLDKATEESISQLGERETLFFKSSTGLILTCWKDSKVVYMLSNHHATDSVAVERNIGKKEIDKRKKRGEVIENYREEVQIPRAIADYTMHMRGVDLFDQKASYYSTLLSSKRWYIKIFYHLLDIAVINSYILYQKTMLKAQKKPLSHIEYRKEVARGLMRPLRVSLGLKTTKKKELKRKLDQVIEISFDDCLLGIIPTFPGRLTNRYPCQIHKAEGGHENRTPQTSYWCKSCKVYVCAIPCYDKHRKIVKS